VASTPSEILKRENYPLPAFLVFNQSKAISRGVESYSDGFAELVCANATDGVSKPLGTPFGISAAVSQATVIRLQALQALRGRDFEGPSR
jgi:hypothetical protein